MFVLFRKFAYLTPSFSGLHMKQILFYVDTWHASLWLFLASVSTTLGMGTAVNLVEIFQQAFCQLS